MSPWLRALPFWAHPLLLPPSWLAVLRWCWRKIWSLNLPRLFLSGRLCSYCLFLHAKHFPYLCSPEFILAFRSLALISPSQEALLTSFLICACSPPVLLQHTSPFHLKLAFWHLSPIETSQQLINLSILPHFYLLHPSPPSRLNGRKIFVCVIHCVFSVPKTVVGTQWVFNNYLVNVD